MRTAKRAALTAALLLPVAGCGGCNEASTADSPAPTETAPASAPDPERSGPDALESSGALERYGDLPVPADFEAEAEARIDAQNYRERLERLERDFASE